MELEYKIRLTKGQINKLRKGGKFNKDVNIKILAKDIGVGQMVPVTAEQFAQLETARRAGKGVVVTFPSGTLGATGGVLPILLAGLGALATGALGAAGAWGTDKALNAIDDAVTNSVSKKEAIDQAMIGQQMLDSLVDAQSGQSKTGKCYNCSKQMMPKDGYSIFPNGIREH